MCLCVSITSPIYAVNKIGGKKSISNVNHMANFFITCSYVFLDVNSSCKVPQKLHMRRIQESSRLNVKWNIKLARQQRRGWEGDGGTHMLEKAIHIY